MRRYVVTVLANGGDRTDEWADWGRDHVADMIKLPGFIGCQAFRRRPDFSFAHPEVLPTLPPYTIWTFYEVDAEGLAWLTTRRRPAGAGPEAGTRSFPTPLGEHVGNTFLWEATSPDFHARRDPAPAKRFVVMALTAGGAQAQAWEDWCADHAADMIAQPGYVRSQAFRVRPDFTYDHPETVASKPPYTAMTLYEVNDAGVERMTTTRRAAGAGPQAGTRGFPTPLGPHVGDTYLWEQVSAEFRAHR